MRDFPGGRWLGTIALLATIASPSRLEAQWNTTHIEDASTAPKGLLRIRAASVWTRYNERFTGTGTEPLGAMFTADSLGVNRIGQLLDVETDIATAAGTPFTLSLGRSRLGATAREDLVPMVFEYGISNRISVGVTIPVVRKRVAAQFQLDTAGGYVANVGPNPARTLATAAATNAQVQIQFASAATQLQNRLSSCNANPAGGGCAALLARQAEAQQLIASSQGFATALGAVYGTVTSTGAAFVPITASATQAAIAARVSGFNTQYKDFLTTSADLLTQVPVGAGGPAGVLAFQEYLRDDLGRDTISFQERIFGGDVEIGAKWLAIDRQRSDTRHLGVQLAMAASWHIPTGTSISPSEIVDLRTTENAHVVDLRTIADLRYARFGVIVAGRAAIAGSVAVVEPALTPRPSGDTTFPFAESSSWSEFSVAPRWHLGEPFSIHGAYSYRTSDKNGGDQLAGVGVSFTTVEKYDGSTLPIEMRYTHLEAISGAPGRSRFVRDQIELRVYFRLRKG
jgi:hypothetical protein